MIILMRVTVIFLGVLVGVAVAIGGTYLYTINFGQNDVIGVMLGILGGLLIVLSIQAATLID